MQSLNHFTNFQLDSQEAINVNGGRGRRFGKGGRGRRFGKKNTQLLEAITLNTEADNYKAFDFSNFEAPQPEVAAIPVQPEFISDDLAPAQVIL